jgi:hypothetical protein
MNHSTQLAISKPLKDTEFSFVNMLPGVARRLGVFISASVRKKNKFCQTSFSIFLICAATQCVLKNCLIYCQPYISCMYLSGIFDL